MHVTETEKNNTNHDEFRWAQSNWSDLWEDGEYTITVDKLKHGLQLLTHTSVAGIFSLYFFSSPHNIN